jgi:hypothetical protein
MQMVMVEMPKGFTGRTREQLFADPTTVPLRDHSPAYYHVGIALSELIDSDLDAATLPTTTRVALAMRLPLILDQSLNSFQQDTHKFLTLLTDLERQVFNNGYSYARDRHAWKRRKGFAIQASTLVTTSRKRRRVAAA